MNNVKFTCYKLLDFISVFPEVVVKKCIGFTSRSFFNGMFLVREVVYTVLFFPYSVSHGLFFPDFSSKEIGYLEEDTAVVVIELELFVLPCSRILVNTVDDFNNRDGIYFSLEVVGFNDL